MKNYLAALGVAFCIASPAIAAPSSNYLQAPPDRTQSMDFGGTQASCTASGALHLNGQGLSTVSVVITGTFVGTLQFKAAADALTTYNSVNAYPQAGGAAVTSATAAGTWFISAAGYADVCVYVSAYTSGTASVRMEGSVGLQRNFSGSDVATIGGAALAFGSAASAASIPVVIASDQGAVATTNAAQALAQASTTSGQTGPLAQTATTTAAPSYTNAKTNPLSSTTYGALRVDISGGGSTAFAADGATIAGVPVPTSNKAVADAAAPTQVTAGQAAYGLATLERIPIVTTRHPNHIQCVVTVSTATTIQAVGGSCAAPAAGLSLYITDITFSTNAAGIAADSFNTLKSGTGGTCGVATAVVYQCMTTAATQATCEAHLQTPIKLPAINELCWINSTAGSKTLNIEGYIAP